MLIPRHGFKALNGFDEKFDTDYADLDLCHRAAAAGGSVLFQPEAAGVQFTRAQRGRRRPVQGLTLFAMKSARTPAERAFATIAGPALAVLIGLRDLIVGRHPGAR
jgi:GT2 family glycosyltransferase